MATGSQEHSEQNAQWFQPRGDFTTMIAPPDIPVIEMARSFDAPDHLVFEAHTNPRVLARWWGPRAMKMVLCEVDLDVGSEYRFILRGRDGREFGFSGIYREIHRPHRLVYTEEFSGAPRAEAHNTILVEQQGSEALVNITVLHSTVSNRNAHLAAGYESVVREAHARLDELFDRRMLSMQRIIDVPRERVFEAWTDPVMLAKWCAPHEYAIPIYEADVRKGGHWQRLMQSPSGQEQWAGGRYLEVSPGERLVMTHGWEPDVDEQQVTTNVVLTFESIGGRTSIKLDQAFFETASSRDAHRDGWHSTLERLEYFLR